MSSPGAKNRRSPAYSLGSGSRIDMANTKATKFIPGPGNYTASDTFYLKIRSQLRLWHEQAPRYHRSQENQYSRSRRLQACFKDLKRGRLLNARPRRKTQVCLKILKVNKLDLIEKKK